MEIRHSDVLPTFDMMAALDDVHQHQHTQVLLSPEWISRRSGTAASKSSKTNTSCAFCHLAVGRVYIHSVAKEKWLFSQPKVTMAYGAVLEKLNSNQSRRKFHFQDHSPFLCRCLVHIYFSRHDHSCYTYCRSVIWFVHISIYPILPLTVLQPLHVTNYNQRARDYYATPVRFPLGVIGDDNLRFDQSSLHTPEIQCLTVLIPHYMLAYQFCNGLSTIYSRINLQTSSPQQPASQHPAHPSKPYKTIPISINPNFHIFPVCISITTSPIGTMPNIIITIYSRVHHQMQNRTLLHLHIYRISESCRVCQSILCLPVINTLCSWPSSLS